MKTTICLTMIIAGLFASSNLAHAQTDDAKKQQEAELMLELDKILPRKAPNPNQVATFGHSVDWDAKLRQLGELLAKSAGTRVEPQVLFIMGNSLFAAGRITEAKASFEDLKSRFANHGLVKKVLGENEITAVDQALEACNSELTFRQRYGKKSLPGAQLDDSMTVTLHLTAGDVTIKFFKDAAPKHRENFIKLAKNRFYDRTRVHRVNPGRYIHLGDPNSRERDTSQWGRGDPGYTLPSEFSLATHRRGTLTMNRATGRNRSHGCQFQVLLTDQPHLDFGQTAFAEVVEGIDIVEEVSRRSRNQYEAPVHEVYINGITIGKSKTN